MTQLFFDVVAALLVLGVAVSIAFLLGVAAPTLHLAWGALTLPLVPGAFATAGLYPGVGLNDAQALKRMSIASTILLVGFALALWASGLIAGVWIGVLAVPLAWITFPLVRSAVEDAFAGTSWWGIPVVVVGSEEACGRLIRDLRDQAGQPFRPVAIFDPSATRTGGSSAGLPFLEDATQAASLVRRGVRHAIAVTTLEDPDGAPSVSTLPFPHVIVSMPSAVQPPRGAAALGLGSGIGWHRRQARFSWLDLAMKRVFDLALLIPTGLVAIPIVGVAALLVRLVDYGDPFYEQERIGLDGKPFKVLKLRTMYLDAEERLIPYLNANPEARDEWARTYKLTNDVRILPGIGHFLRMSSLDELPQLWNIFKGEMSFVGPRPFPQYHLDAFDDTFQRYRAQVMPGLTGLWQITARSNSDLTIQERLDSEYIATWSMWHDLAILIHTPAAVLSGRGAR